MPLLNPERSYPLVFLFPIHKAINAGRDVYESTRRSWSVKATYRQGGAIALGIVNGLSQSSYMIDVWNRDTENNAKYIFDGHSDNIVSSNFLDFDCSNVINPAQSYWRYGNYLIANFDGQGRCRILRGNGRNAPWFPLV